MEKYIPPFNITNDILKSVSSIMKKLGRLEDYRELNKMPILRRNNRIKSIHSSLSIEANSLSFNQVKDVIDGKEVIGPINEIQEVKNAYNAYLMIKEVDPYSVEDLKKMHSVMTDLVVKESGVFRSGEEGVFDENGNCIHLCPPPEKVNDLMHNLFLWMREKRSDIHPLILSSIFHYEFVFIHPFSDGNGRMARLWQNVLLADWEEIFEYVPIESQIEKYQDDYYKAISKSNINGDSTVFIEFMLKMIDEVLDGLIIGVNNHIKHFNFYVTKLLNEMEFGVKYKSSELMGLINMKSRDSFRKNYLLPAIDGGYIKMSYPDNPTNKNQTYYKE